MTALLSALSSGLSAKKILEYLMRKSPELAPRISSSLAAGISAEKILKFFSKGNNFEKLKSSMEEQYPMENNANPLVQALRIRGQNLANDPASQLQRAVPGLLGGIGALGAGMALNHALPNLLKSSIPEKTEKIAQNASSISPISTAPQISSEPVSSPIIAESTSTIPPQVKTINISEILNKYSGFESKINDLLKTGNTPEAISTYFKQFNSAQTKKLEKESGKPIEEIVNEYASQSKAQKPEVVKEPSKSVRIDNKLVEEEIPIEMAKVEKGSMVASPKGIGEIREIRNGKAIIEVDGKKHQVDEDELIQSPLPEKDIADLYDELIEGIEKTTGKQVSRNVEWAGYDPKTNELAYKPHGSDNLYAYDDISEEDVNLLTSLMTQRKSTGENFIGAWEKGTESPIGAAMYQLIKRLQAQRGGKGNEYKNKWQTIYDALEPAKVAAKRKHVERKKKAKKSIID